MSGSNIIFGRTVVVAKEQESKMHKPRESQKCTGLSSIMSGLLLDREWVGWTNGKLRNKCKLTKQVICKNLDCTKITKSSTIKFGFKIVNNKSNRKLQVYLKHVDFLHLQRLIVIIKSKLMNQLLLKELKKRLNKLQNRK